MLSPQLRNKLESLKAEILVCGHRKDDSWCSQCLHRAALLKDLENLIEEEVKSGSRPETQEVA